MTVDEMANRWNCMQTIEMTLKMKTCLNEKLIIWHTDESASWWNGNLLNWQLKL